QLRKMLQSTPYQVHVSFDLWTSPNSLAMLGIVGHWINENHQLTIALLGLRQIAGPHSGEHLSDTVLDVIKDFELQSHLGHFMLDNASSNNTCVKILSEKMGDAFLPMER